MPAGLNARIQKPTNEPRNPSRNICHRSLHRKILPAVYSASATKSGNAEPCLNLFARAGTQQPSAAAAVIRKERPGNCCLTQNGC